MISVTKPRGATVGRSLKRWTFPLQAEVWVLERESCTLTVKSPPSCLRIQMVEFEVWTEKMLCGSCAARDLAMSIEERGSATCVSSVAPDPVVMLYCCPLMTTPYVV